jgi:aminoglycoside/choline kinase family phosphotransferase
MDARLEAARTWLASLAGPTGLDPSSLTPASSDASFRRYFRLQHAQGTAILMDAPPSHEDCRPFVDVARRLLMAGVSVPRILAQDLTQGFLLLEDFGRVTYQTALQSPDGPAASAALYREACAALVRFQAAAPTAGLPVYDAARLRQEMQLFPDWFMVRHHGMRLNEADQQALERIETLLVKQALSQSQVLVHRDYHSRNLMVLPGPESPGILDFQDAVLGPITYDLVSLLRDAYISHDEDWEIDLSARYWEMARKAGLPVPDGFDVFYRDLEWMGLQRHLKVLGIFCRLWHRDGKPGYLSDLPRVQAYTRRVAQRYGVFAPLLRWLDAVEQVQVKVGYTF